MVFPLSGFCFVRSGSFCGACFPVPCLSSAPSSCPTGPCGLSQRNNQFEDHVAPSTGKRRMQYISRCHLQRSSTHVAAQNILPSESRHQQEPVQQGLDPGRLEEGLRFGRLCVKTFNGRCTRGTEACNRVSPLVFLSGQSPQDCLDSGKQPY